MDHNKKALELHEKKQGKIEIVSKVSVKTAEDLSVSYTPGVAAPCLAIHEHPEDVYRYTTKGNMVAVLTDGSAVLGLGNIGPEAALPVMEGKAILFKEFGGIDAFPIAVDSQDTEDIIKTAKMIAPGFGGINLEDISAPRCFEIEERLKEELDIPVFHDDQHGTAVVVLAGLMNALKLKEKTLEETKVVVVGAGAAGTATTKLLLKAGVKDMIVLDSKGTIYEGRVEGMNSTKEELAKVTNRKKLRGDIHEALKGADVFIGVSRAGLLNEEDIKNMNSDPIIFAMANPVPEIEPELAKKAGAFVVATGRSDHPNQVNNVLAFPGIFRGALDCRATDITDEMKMIAAEAIASCVEKPTPDEIIPSAFDKNVAKKVARCVKRVCEVQKIKKKSQKDRGIVQKRSI
ncbi:MAG: NADP-dependent malic enzyme [Candidatus Pacebacteria bacterium]|nr:NADP-dependent malic enzyme [Candidatus Paceibacterota bacterium]